jgi:predicted transcriptional regulator
MSTTSVRIDTDQYKELQRIAERRGLKIVQVLRKALARYIGESKKP